MRLDGKRVLVIGGSAGIGLAAARAALAAGAQVHIAGRSAATLEQAAAGLAVAGRHVVDAADLAACSALAAAIAPIDHLVLTVSASSSATGANASLREVDLDGAERFMFGKFWAQYRAARACLAAISGDGSITFTSGIAARKILPRHTVIAATNAAIEAMARQLAREIAPQRVNVVSPGLTRTRTYDRLAPEARAAFFKTISDQLPVGHIASSEEIGLAYLFCMSASYLSGSTIEIDGGLMVG